MKHKKFSLLLLTLLGLMMACSLPFPAGPSQEAGQKSFTLSGSETDFDYDGIKISIRRDEPGEDIPLRIKTLPDPAPPTSDEEGAYASEIYILEDFPQNFQGILELRFPLPQEVVELKSANPDEYLIQALVGSNADPEQLSTMDEAMHFDVEIDHDSEEAILTLVADPDRPSFYRRSGLLQDGTYVQDGVTVQISSGWGSTAYAETEHFTLEYYDDIDNATIKVLMAEFEKVFQTIQDLGIDLGKFAADDKIYVELEPMEGKDGSMSAGLFTDPYLNINSENLHRNDDGNIGDLSNDMRGTLAHETFHIAQYLDHGRHNDEFLWLDEASACWFEIHYLERQYGVTDYLGQASIEYKGFFLHSQLEPSPSSPSRGDLGYGAAIFYRHLVQLYGLDFVTSTFAGGSNETAVLMEALSPYNTDLTKEWMRFLQRLFREPSSLTPIPKRTINEVVDLFALINQKEIEEGYELTAIAPNLDDAFHFTPGQLNTAGELVKPLEIHYIQRLEELQAKIFILRANKARHSLNPSDLLVEVSSPADAGVMVFGLAKDTDHTGGAVLAGQDTYLNSWDTGETKLTVSTFGTEGKADYAQVLFVLFNAEYSFKETDPALVTVKVSLKPTDPPSKYVSDSMTVTRHIPKDVCHKMPPGADSCVDNPPCSKSGGSSSGGVITDDMTACLDIPDWCYECDTDYPVNQLNFGYDGEITMTLEMNGAGEIVGVRDTYGPWMYYANGDVPNEPEIEHDLSTGEFRITFPGLFLDYLDRVNPNGYLIYEGIIEGDQAKGTWELGYEGAGTFFSADWTASAER